MSFLFFLTIFCLAPIQTWGFESLPEFGWLDENEATNDFTRPQGSEFMSDQLAYMKPEAWEYDWLTHDVAADFTVGSISSIHFMLDNRVKLRKKLLDTVEFRFTYLDDRHFEHEIRRHVFEAIIWPVAKFGLGIYMDPSYIKKDDDTGVALYYKPTEKSEIKFFHTWVDPSRNNRNDKTDRIADGKYAKSIGLVGRTTTEEKGEFYEAALRYEPRAVWDFPDQNARYEYYKWFASVWMRKKMSDDFFLNSRIQYDNKMESKLNEAWTNSRTLILLRGQFTGIGENNNQEVLTGLMTGLRRYHVTTGDFKVNEILPHVWWKLPSIERTKWQSFWNLGLESTLHFISGEDSLNKPKSRNGKIEGRFNAAYEVAFSDSVDFRFLATFDIDRITTSDRWEGGDMQLRLHF